MNIYSRKMNIYSRKTNRISENVPLIECFLQTIKLIYLDFPHVLS